jgi:hypothetical protein
LYVSNEQVVEREKMFVVWDYKGANVILSTMCIWRIVLDVVNMFENYLYNDIFRELHVYDT